MKNKILAAQQEDAARRLIQTMLLRQGFFAIDPQDDLSQLQRPGERLVVISYQLSVTDNQSTAPKQTITMAARPDDLFLHTGGLNIDELRFDGLVISYPGRAASVDGRQLPLTLKEFELLSYLAYHRNLALTREQLLSAVWEIGYSGDVRTVDCHIKCIRQKLGEYARCIVTLRGIGYSFHWKDEPIG